MDDVLHVVYRGFAPDLIASALLDMFAPDQLSGAFECAKAWSNAGPGRTRELSCDEFVIGYEGNFPTLFAKGHDCKVLIYWLAT